MAESIGPVMNKIRCPYYSVTLIDGIPMGCDLAQHHDSLHETRVMERGVDYMIQWWVIVDNTEEVKSA